MPNYMYLGHPVNAKCQLTKHIKSEAPNYHWNSGRQITRFSIIGFIISLQP